MQTIEDAKKFVADKFGVTPDRVWQLGESYFLHTGVTPQRVYPFVVADAGKPDNMSWQYTNMKKIKSLIYGFRVCSTELAKDFVRIHMMMGDDHTLGGDRSFENSRHKPFTLNTDSLPGSISLEAHKGAKTFSSSVITNYFPIRFTIRILELGHRLP